MKYGLKNEYGISLFSFPSLERKVMEERLFSHEIKLEYVYLNEHDWFYYDEENDEEDYSITKEYIKFVYEFLDMLDGEYSDKAIMHFFNENYNPPYKHLIGAKLYYNYENKDE